MTNKQLLLYNILTTGLIRYSTWISPSMENRHHFLKFNLIDEEV